MGLGWDAENCTLITNKLSGYQLVLLKLAAIPVGPTNTVEQCVWSTQLVSTAEFVSVSHLYLFDASQ